MRREIPARRQAGFALVAETSKTETILVVCRSPVVRRQYEDAIRRLGGNLDNVIFRTVPFAIFEKGSLS